MEIGEKGGGGGWRLEVGEGICLGVGCVGLVVIEDDAPIGACINIRSIRGQYDCIRQQLVLSFMQAFQQA